MTTLLGGLISLVGFGLLALAQSRHWSAVTGLTPGTQPRRARSLGLLLQGLVLPLLIAGHGASFGSLLWVLLMGLAAFAVSMLLACRRRPGVIGDHDGPRPATAPPTQTAVR